MDKSYSMKLSSILMGTACVLAGCGSGGESMPTQDASAGSNAGTPSFSPPPSAVTRTAQLEVPGEFTFISNDDFVISVDLAEDAHISVCLTNGSMANTLPDKISYENCLLRSWARPGNFEGAISLPRHINHLIAAVLVPGKSTTPFYFEWLRQEELEWTINQIF